MAAEPKRKGRHRLGPIFVTPKIELKNAGVDTNVFQTLQEPVRDAVVVVGPKVDASAEVGKRLRLTGSGGLELNYFHREGDETSTDFFGDGGAELDLGPFTVFGGGGGGQFHQRFSIDIDERLKRQERYAAGGITWKLSRRLSLTGRGRTEVFTFAPGNFRLGGDIKTAMDRHTLTGAGQLRFALSNRTTLALSGEVLEDRFFSQPLNTPRVRRSYRYLGGVELSPRALVSGRLMVGYREFPGTLAQGSPPYRGPIVAADLTLPVRDKARLRAAAERDVLYASSLVEVGTLLYRNAFILERYQLEATLDLPLRLVGFAGVGFEEADYLLPYPYPSPAFLSERTDHRYTLSAALVRRLSDSFRIGGHVSWARRVSTLALFSYEGMRYGISAEILP